MKNFNQILMAVSILSTIAIVHVHYENYQDKMFDAANPLLKENLSALADPGGGSSSVSSSGVNNQLSGVFYTVQTRSRYKLVYIAPSLKGKINATEGKWYNSDFSFGFSTDSIKYEQRDQYQGTCGTDYVANYRGCIDSKWDYCASKGCPVARTYLTNEEYDQYNCK